MEGFTRRAARDGTAEFGYGDFNVLQSQCWRFWVFFFSIIGETEILRIGVAMDQKAVPAVGTDVPSTCPGERCGKRDVL